MSCEPIKREASGDKMHTGTLAMQERYGTIKAGARIAATVRNHLNSQEMEFIEKQAWFFMASADEQGRPDCSFRGGSPGFVKVLDHKTLVFPDYKGNGSFMSLGNFQVNPQVGLLFIDFQRAKRIRVGGLVDILDGEEAGRIIPGADRLVRICVTHAHPNCSRYIPSLKPSLCLVGRVKKCLSWIAALLSPFR